MLTQNFPIHVLAVVCRTSGWIEKCHEEKKSPFLLPYHLREVLPTFALYVYISKHPVYMNMHRYKIIRLERRRYKLNKKNQISSTR